MAALYFVAGITHFTHTRFFVYAVPKVLIYRRFIALFSGVLEIMIALGISEEGGVEMKMEWCKKMFGVKTKQNFKVLAA